MDKKRILWIEDEVRRDVTEYAVPVFMDGRYDLIIAENASEGVASLLHDKSASNKFAAVIVDIRLQPGDDPIWVKQFQDSGHTAISARLGLKILQDLVGEKTPVDRRLRELQIKKEQVGVFTIETEGELRTAQNPLSPLAYRQKTGDAPKTTLLDIIREILGDQER